MAYTTIDKSSLHFKAKLYTGTGSSNAITGIGFAPDWTWIKARGASTSNQLVDNVRGATKMLASDNNSAEFTAADRVASLDSDGFTLGTNSNTNASSGAFISWNWKAGTTSGISAGSQTITPSSYSISTTAGIGIYKWSRTGASTTDYFSHGLGATPTIAIQKRTDDVQDWYVNTTIIDGTNDNLHLNKTDVKEDDSTTVPTSTNYYPKSPETGDYITYLFAPITGFSKFGFYTGNNNTDGPFVYTGFKPAFIILRSTGIARNWTNWDNARDISNPAWNYIYPNLSSSGTNLAHGTSGSYAIDFCSNGFKIRNTDDKFNGSGEGYIYLAFAEEPFVASNGDPATAR